MKDYKIETFEIIIEGKSQGWSFAYGKKGERLKCVLDDDGELLSYFSQKSARDGAIEWIYENEIKS